MKRLSFILGLVMVLSIFTSCATITEENVSGDYMDEDDATTYGVILSNDILLREITFENIKVYSEGNFDDTSEFFDVPYSVFPHREHNNSTALDEIEDTKTITLFGKTYTGKFGRISESNDYTEKRIYYHTDNYEVVFALYPNGMLADFSIHDFAMDPKLPELNEEECLECVKRQIAPYIDIDNYSTTCKIIEIDKGVPAYLINFVKYVGKVKTNDALMLMCLPNGQITDLFPTHLGEIDSSLNIDEQVEKISKELCGEGEWEEKQSDGSVHKFKKSVQDVYLSVLSDGTPYLDFTIDLKETREYTDEKGEKVTEDILHEAIELIVIPE